VLAVAQPDFLGLGQVELLRAESAAFVAAVAHGLVAAQAAGAPPMVSGWQFDGDGLFFVNFGEGFHGSEFGRDERSVKAVKAAQSRCGQEVMACVWLIP